jgi:hypothetical protein
MTLLISRIFSGISHLFYGITTLFVPFYIDEFIRYGFSDFRVLIGLSQVVFGLGLLLGRYNVKITIVSSGFLALLMTGALIIRILIKDDSVQTLPAIGYLIINSFIFIKSMQSLKTLK